MRKNFKNQIMLGIVIFAIGISFVAIGLKLKSGPFRGAWSFWFNNDEGVTIGAEQLEALSEIKNLSAASIDRAANTVRFSGPGAVIPVIADPYGEKHSYDIYGLVNPTVEVRKGSKVTIELVNADLQRYHGFVIISAKPPYSYAPTFMHSESFTRAVVPPVAYGRNGSYHIFKTDFKADSTGTFYYICQVPGCASGGMYGKFVVADSFGTNTP